MFCSHGRARTDEFSVGDLGYVPQATATILRTPAATSSS
jgi:hypothetical protein